MKPVIVFSVSLLLMSVLMPVRFIHSYVVPFALLTPSVTVSATFPSKISSATVTAVPTQTPVVVTVIHTKIVTVIPTTSTPSVTPTFTKTATNTVTPTTVSTEEKRDWKPVSFNHCHHWDGGYIHCRDCPWNAMVRFAKTLIDPGRTA